MSLALWLGNTTETRWQRGVPVLTVLLAALLLYSVIQLFWALFPKPTQAASGPSTPIVRTAAPEAPSAPLGNYHLFGENPSGAMLTAPDAPETQLKLTLIGTAAGRDPKTGVAIIADEAGKQREYQAGEIVGGATVDSIFTDRVVLMYQGRLETLKLPRLSNAAGSQVAQNSVNTPGTTAQVVSSNADPSNGYVNPGALNGTAAQFQAVREQVMANPAQVMGMLAPQFDANGNLDGVKLNGSGANDALLKSAGILAGDVIVAVNGQRIDSISKGQEIANSLASADQAVLVVRRDGREITLPAVRFR
jgi:general secretion pathway protein C